jgi:hypothetical protein
MKIRLLTLWIARSPRRRQDWKEVSPSKKVSYDVTFLLGDTSFQSWRRRGLRAIHSVSNRIFIIAPFVLDTRWNSTYLMIQDALRLQTELGQFVRIHPEVQAPW